MVKAYICFYHAFVKQMNVYTLVNKQKDSATSTKMSCMFLSNLFNFDHDYLDCARVKLPTQTHLVRQTTVNLLRDNWHLNNNEILPPKIKAGFELQAK